MSVWGFTIFYCCWLSIHLSFFSSFRTDKLINRVVGGRPLLFEMGKFNWTTTTWIFISPLQRSLLVIAKREREESLCQSLQPQEEFGPSRSIKRSNLLSSNFMQSSTAYLKCQTKFLWIFWYLMLRWRFDSSLFFCIIKTLTFKKDSEKN